jgi:hypothetical protein
VLFVVALYAVRDVWSRRARKDWNRTLDVAVVVVHVEGTAQVDPEATRALGERAMVLEDRLRAESERYHASAPSPFRIRVHGPVEVASAPPTPASDSPVDLAKQAALLGSWLRDVDPKAGIVPEHWDTRIYVTARRPASKVRSFVEGQSERDGRIGVVDVELDPSMVDVTLFVVAHELMHTLGATDKYDALGRSLVPDGLAEPSRSPLYPQRFAEIMAQNRPVSPTSETIPESLDELAVGAVTAKEIGWLR